MQALKKFTIAYRDADVETLSGMLTEQYIHSNSGKSVIRKKDWLKYIESRKKSIENGVLKINDFYNRDVVIETYGDAAVVHGINEYAGAENDFDGCPGKNRTYRSPDNQVWCTRYGGRFGWCPAK